mmetsp:Transcript_115149/g.246084  ORF Transcript_115149/g.246084 Transcript_115149/m.246084 type:complete len:202 (-) Transcript_115149:2795-3400(-)
MPFSIWLGMQSSHECRPWRPCPTKTLLSNVGRHSRREPCAQCRAGLHIVGAARLRPREDRILQSTFGSCGTQCGGVHPAAAKSWTLACPNWLSENIDSTRSQCCACCASNFSTFACRLSGLTILSGASFDEVPREDGEASPSLISKSLSMEMLNCAMRWSILRIFCVASVMDSEGRSTSESADRSMERACSRESVGTSRKN